SESRDMPLQPPSERMKPEHSSIQQRHPLNKRITSPNVLALVREYGVELSLRPLRPICGQNHHRIEPSHGDGGGARCVCQIALIDKGAADEPSDPQGTHGKPKQERG